MDRVPLTTYGHSLLENELRERRNGRRPAIIKAIEEALEHGDLKENAEYHSAKEEQGMNEARIKELESKLSRVNIIDPTKMSGTTVQLGATIDLVDMDTDEEITYVLVGPDEANLERNLISTTSPIGRALMGKNAGDEATFNAPSGKREFEIVKVRFVEIKG